MPSCLRRTARTVARTSIGCASAGGGGLTWASTASLSRKPSCCLSFRVMCRYPRRKRSTCRTVLSESRDTSTPGPRRAGTAALPREQAGPSAPRQDPAALTAATSACALLTSAGRYRSCSPGPGTREEARRQAILTVPQIDRRTRTGWPRVPTKTGPSALRRQWSGAEHRRTREFERAREALFQR